VSYSTDEGETWTTPLNTGAPGGFEYTSLAVAGTNFYLGGAGICGLCDQGGVYVSTNSGNSWNKKGLSNISTLVTNGTNIYAVTFNSPFVSHDTGSTWDILSIPANINAIAFRDSEMFVGFISLSGGNFGGGVLHSTDGAKTWRYIDNGLPSDINEWVISLAVHGKYVFAGTTAGVYVLNNDDTSWSAVNNGLSAPYGRVYYLATTDSNLYAGFSGTVWKRPISEIVTSVNPSPTRKPTSISLFQNYPNPFNPSTIISYQLPRNTFVTLDIYDMLGRKVKTMINELQTAGTHSVMLNGSNLASGVYFYRLKTEESEQARKLILIK